MLALTLWRLCEFLLNGNERRGEDFVRAVVTASQGHVGAGDGDLPHGRDFECYSRRIADAGAGFFVLRRVAFCGHRGGCAVHGPRVCNHAGGHSGEAAIVEYAAASVGAEIGDFSPEAIRGSVRTWGNGGFFSFTGLFWNRELGNYRAFMLQFRPGDLR